PEKIDVLALALGRAVGKGHDNELFVLLADLLELETQLDPLLKAVKMTISRHHQVMVVCPWPPGVAPPGSADRPRTPGFLSVLHESLRRATATRFHQAYHQVRRTFARLG